MAFVVWEHVLQTDWATPPTATLSLIADRRVRQYWDPDRSLSKRMGEKPGESETIIWDWVGIYPPGIRWDCASPPEPVYQDIPVVRAADAFEQKLRETLAGSTGGTPASPAR